MTNVLLQFCFDIYNVLNEKFSYALVIVMAIHSRWCLVALQVGVQQAPLHLKLLHVQ